MLKIKHFLKNHFAILLVGLLTSSWCMANSVTGIRVWPGPDETRVVIDMKQAPEYTYFQLSDPERLVVDLKVDRFSPKLPIVPDKQDTLNKIRASQAPDGKTKRLVFELKNKTTASLFKLQPVRAAGYGHRLVIDLPKINASSAVVRSTKSEINIDASQLAGNSDIVIALDPGHGGEDPGSIGSSGHYEKTVTLLVAKKLQRELNKIKGIKAVLTRTGDYYVRVDRRSEIARKYRAHLLVSIHADAFTNPRPRGASVFVLNNRRGNTEFANLLEQEERQHELIDVGKVLANNAGDEHINQTFIDLQFDNTKKEGYRVAQEILTELGEVTHLHNHKPVGASLGVLKSTDIPSVLVELGFMSNPTEERLLFNSRHQNKLTASLKVALVDYFRLYPPVGTYFASMDKLPKHLVKRGDTLAKIASQYKLSVQDLMDANALSSQRIRVGQKLIVGRLKNSNLPSKTSLSGGNLVKSTINYKVKRGDYLGKIAEKYKVSIEQIKRLNNLKSNTLSVGQSLKIPVSSNVSTIIHRVKRGEYLGKLADIYKVPLDSIRATNHLRSDELAIGQELKIPVN